MTPMTDTGQTPLERVIAFAPPHLADELRQFLTFIDAPASAQGLQRVARKLEDLGFDLGQVAESSGGGMILWPSNFPNSLRWILSEAANQSFVAAGIDPLGGAVPPRGTLTKHPIYAALWLVSSTDQRQIRDALMQVVVAHAMLPAPVAEADQYRSAREKAGRAVRELAKLDPGVLLSWLPAQMVRSATAYAVELKSIIDSAGAAASSTDLGSIRHLIAIATAQRDVRRRSSGGRHQSTRQRASRRQVEVHEVSLVETHSAEDVGAAATVIVALPAAEIAADLENSGSLSSEIEPSSEILIVRNEEKPGAERSAMQNRVRVQAVVKGIARSNQKLVGQVATLSPLEIEALIEEITRVCTARSASPVSVKAAVLVCCSLATGRSFEDLACIVEGTEDRNDSLSLERQGRWYFFKVRALALQGAQDLPALGQDQAVKTGFSVSLPCPSLVQRCLAKVLQSSSGTCAFVGAAMLIVGAQEFLAKASKARSARFTERRVQGWLFGQILNLRDGGIAAAALITATSDPLSTNPAQYLTLSSTEVIELYLRAVKQLNRIEPAVIAGNVIIPSEADLAIGSRYLPRQEALAAFIAKMQGELAAVKNVEGNFVAIHNVMTLYTVMMSCFACGFRTVREPVLRPSEIDEATGFAVLQDKDSQDGYNARLIWVPLTMRSQLQFYAAHLGRIRNAIRQTDPVRYQQMEPSPSGQTSTGLALFLLDECGVSRAATVVALKEAFARAGWYLPLNAGRHYLQTSLRRHCSKDTMLAFLGHWSRGTEPWSSASALDPEMYRADLGPALTRLIEEDGWKPVSGFKQ